MKLSKLEEGVFYDANGDIYYTDPGSGFHYTIMLSIHRICLSAGLGFMYHLMDDPIAERFDLMQVYGPVNTGQASMASIKSAVSNMPFLLGQYFNLNFKDPNSYKYSLHADNLLNITSANHTKEVQLPETNFLDSPVFEVPLGTRYIRTSENLAIELDDQLRAKRVAGVRQHDKSWKNVDTEMKIKIVDPIVVSAIEASPLFLSPIDVANTDNRPITSNILNTVDDLGGNHLVHYLLMRGSWNSALDVMHRMTPEQLKYTNRFGESLLHSLIGSLQQSAQSKYTSSTSVRDIFRLLVQHGAPTVTQDVRKLHYTGLTGSTRTEVVEFLRMLVAETIATEALSVPLETIARRRSM
ncbi:hypothetical protein ACKF11_13340 [Methylobacillus sp. Pita2]|uniref:hypothetical protein n=1 Tax=Methylobacillus sp. Pita2 TaxID=3383245 RepID=UPI0038B52E2B